MYILTYIHTSLYICIYIKTIHAYTYRVASQCHEKIPRHTYIHLHVYIHTHTYYTCIHAMRSHSVI